MKANIVLIGFMGSGKTTVGKELAKELQMDFIDTDADIEKEAGITIKEMFEKHGESFFRDLETSKAKETDTMENCVISTGGGIILRPENVTALRKNSFVVLLAADSSTIYDRVKGKNDRPLLNVPDPIAKIKELLTARKDKYESAAEFIVITDDKSVYEITNIIKAEYLKR